jgi:serine/threonine-protein kinase RsbW
MSLKGPVTLTLPMAPDMEVAASKAAVSVARSMEMSGDKIDEVRHAVVEACINAIEHSHADDRKVHLTMRILADADPQVLEIEVRDGGQGFETESIKGRKSGTAEVPQLRKRGWGLKIIQSLMDEVHIESDDHGTTVVMRKSR